MNTSWASVGRNVSISKIHQVELLRGCSICCGTRVCVAAQSAPFVASNRRSLIQMDVAEALMMHIRSGAAVRLSHDLLFFFMPGGNGHLCVISREPPGSRWSASVVQSEVNSTLFQWTRHHVSSAVHARLRVTPAALHQHQLVVLLNWRRNSWSTPMNLVFTSRWTANVSSSFFSSGRRGFWISPQSD